MKKYSVVVEEKKLHKMEVVADTVQHARAIAENRVRRTIGENLFLDASIVDATEVIPPRVEWGENSRGDAE